MRQFLRLPLTSGYKNLLSDSHEWVLFTDSRLRPLVGKRGGVRSISHDIINDAFDELEKKVTVGKVFEVYLLHTHPRTGSNTPSGNDLTVYVNLPKKYKNVIIKGTGAITSRGILLTIFPDPGQKRDKVRTVFGTDYYTNIRSRITRKIGDPFKAGLLAEGVYEDEGEEYIRGNAQTRAFNEVVRNTKIIKTNMVRPNRRARVKRRRGR